MSDKANDTMATIVRAWVCDQDNGFEDKREVSLEVALLHVLDDGEWTRSPFAKHARVLLSHGVPAQVVIDIIEGVIAGAR